MPSTHPTDKLSRAITDLERSVYSWCELPSGELERRCTKTLIEMEIKDIESLSQQARIDLGSLERLRNIAVRVKAFRGSPLDRAVSKLCEKLIVMKLVDHRSISTPRNHSQSELRQLQDLELWIAMRSTINDMFSISDSCRTRLDSVIKYDLQDLSTCHQENGEIAAAYVLDLAKKVRETLSRDEVASIDRVISKKVTLLRKLESVKNSVSSTCNKGLSSWNQLTDLGC